MSPFEYVSVLISIILGLGISVLLTGLADMIRSWKTVRLYWPYLIWILIVFVLHIQEWWTTYSLRSEMKWTLSLFIFVIVYPIVLFILAHLLFPKKWPKKEINLKLHYFNNYSRYFGAALLLIVISILQNHFLLGYSLRDQYVQFILSAIFLFLLLFQTKKQSVHAAVAVLLISILLLSFVIRPEQLELK